MSITFYYTPQSSAVRVHWALEELGVSYEKVKLDLTAGDQRKPEFLQINPNGKVPAMVIDGTPMFESLAMVLYLGDRFGVDKGLWPAADSPLRIEAYSWSTWASVTLGSNLFLLMRNTSERFPAEQRNAAQATAAKTAIDTDLRLLEERLTGRSYMLGDNFSLCDVAVGYAALFLRFFQYDLSGFPNINAWVGRCVQRPAALAVMQPR